MPAQTQEHSGILQSVNASLHPNMRLKPAEKILKPQIIKMSPQGAKTTLNVWKQNSQIRMDFNKLNEKNLS